MVASDVASFETNFFRIAGTSEAKTSISGNGECLLAIGEDEKSKRLGATCFNFAKINSLMERDREG